MVVGSYYIFISTQYSTPSKTASHLHIKPPVVGNFYYIYFNPIFLSFVLCIVHVMIDLQVLSLQFDPSIDGLVKHMHKLMAQPWIAEIPKSSSVCELNIVLEYPIL